MAWNSSDPIRITRFGILLALVVLFGTFLRLHNLDYMAYHHDESIHAYYAHQFYKGNFSHIYDPTYHGQFLYHFGGLFFLLFGDSEFSGRFPYAVIGILMLYLAWRLKPWVGKSGAFFTLLFVTCSPTLVYFSRFARNDIYMAAWALGILVFSLEYLRHQKTRDLALLTLFLSLMYATKENSYMTGFFFGSFIVFYGIYYIFSFPKEARSQAFYEVLNKRSPFVQLVALYAVYSCFAFTYVGYVTHQDSFRTYVAQARGTHPELSIQFLRSGWQKFAAENPTVFYTWVFCALIAVALIFLAVFWFGRKRDSLPEEGDVFQRIAKKNLPLLFCLLIALVVYSFFFTNMGTHTRGMQAGVVDYLLYWMGQQGDPRIPGPPDYYIPRLAIYEFFPFLVSIFAFFVYIFSGLRTVNFFAFMTGFIGLVLLYCNYALPGETDRTFANVGFLLLFLSPAIFLGKKIVSSFFFTPDEIGEEISPEKPSHSPFAPDGLRVFLIYWSVLSILIYAMLQEKVPWLLVHQAQPLCLLAGVFIGDIWNQLKPGASRTIFIALIGFFFVFEARTSIILNFYNPDNPRETMVYTQTSHQIHKVLDDIDEAAMLLGSDYLPPSPRKHIAVLVGDASWPYSWYLRNYLTYPKSRDDQSLPEFGVPFVITEPQFEDQMKIWSKGEYTKRLIKHQEWWAYAQDELPFMYMKNRNRPQNDAWNALLRYVLYREVWDLNDPSIQPGSKNLLVYKRTPMIKPVESPQAPAGYEKPPVALNIIQTFGTMGTAPGQFNKPRGIALSPDESQLYVLDGANGRIQVFDTNFNFISMIGGPGSQVGEFTLSIVNADGTTSNYGGPNGGIDISGDGTIFATDTWAGGSGRINVYSSENTPLPSLTNAGGQGFYFPRGLAVAPDGKLFVADTGHHQIAWFKPDRTFGATFGKGVVQEPVGMTVAPDGLLYVCDVQNQRVSVFTQNGQFVRQIQLIGWSTPDSSNIPWIEPYIAVDNSGYIYVTDSTRDLIHRFTPDGQQVVIAGLRGTFNDPKGIAVDSQGVIYVADCNNHRIVKARLP